MPPGWKPGDERIDLFADDEILFTIDASNVDKYADKLSPGQIALIKSYDGYKMDVYPTRRSCAFPERLYEVAKNNARVASVDDDCLLTGGVAMPLFPLPQNGCEMSMNGRNAMFNAMRAYERNEEQVVPTRSGAFEPGLRHYITMRPNMMPEYPTFESLNGIWVKSLITNLAPAKKAGEVTLVHVVTDGHYKAWTYNPGQRRVRRNPNFEYDNPNPVGEGLMTVDQVNGFSGAHDRYEWKIVGKQEMYVPYNTEKFFDPAITLQDMAQARYPTRDLIRYELHRVWVLEATVRPGRRHTMPRRVFYVDEDSWIIVVVDAYDSRGNLWRVSEHLPRVLYELPSCGGESSVFYDLFVGRYVLTPILNRAKADYLAGHKGIIQDKGFSPDDLRRVGRR
jgi:hypothetical protein